MSMEGDMRTGAGHSKLNVCLSRGKDILVSTHDRHMMGKTFDGSIQPPAQ